MSQFGDWILDKLFAADEVELAQRKVAQPVRQVEVVDGALDESGTFVDAPPIITTAENVVLNALGGLASPLLRPEEHLQKFYKK